jgi:hypothetical protein
MIADFDHGCKDNRNRLSSRDNTLIMHTKTISVIALSALIGLCLYTSGCQKNNNNNNNNANSAAISVTVGGSVFKPQITNAIYGTISHSFLVAGSTVNSGDSTICTIVLNSPFSLNTDLGVAGKAFITYQDMGKKYLAGAGAGPVLCTVTSLDSVKHTIAGNFSATLFNTSTRDTVTMTNGTFVATYAVVNNF